MAGIYMIINDHTGEFYIGGTTVSFCARFAAHRSALKYGYAVPRLQAAWSAIGHPEHWFRFVPLHECPAELVRTREREAIETLRPVLNVVGVRDGLGEIAAAVRATGMTESAIHYRRKMGLPLDTPKGKRSVIGGEELTLRQISERYGVPLACVRGRYSRGSRGDDLIRAAGSHR